MALKEYEIGDRTYLFDEEDPLLPKDAKLVSEDEVLAEVPAPTDETVQDEPETPVETPADADPAPVADSHVKRGRRTANKQADAPADKSGE